MKLKVLSLNLWNGGRLLEGALDFLAQEDADIVCLQEVYDGTDPGLPPRFRTRQIIEERFDYRSSEFAPAMVDRVPEGEVVSGSLILARFAVTAASSPIFFNETFHTQDPNDPATNPTQPRTLQPVRLETPAGEINVFNIHGVWDLDGEAFTDKRRNMRDKVLAAIKGRPNVILAGDTNAQPTNRAMRDIEEELQSVFGTELTTTFNMRRKQNPGYATARVDMIFVSPDIKVLRRKCHNVDVSDHLPVSATLELE